VTEGQYVMSGMTLLEVADLSTVWVDADIYEYELPWVRVGQKAVMTLTYLPGRTFVGEIEYLYPYLEGKTRTAKIRLKFPNPRLELKPKMFAQVEIKSPLTLPVVTVPAEAVIDTGVKQHVFLALGKGRFAPREVKLGVWGGGGLREVLSGLKGGEEVVTSAQFLLDSESLFKEAAALLLKPGEAKKGGAPAAPPPSHKGLPQPPGSTTKP
jgi:Cu(I)/Ag(I) efflux system membrane fusion protein